jgi:hypothetical protein
MAFYIVTHKVEDFTAWKNIYDGFEPTRKQFKLKEHYALQSIDDTNHVLVVGEGEVSAIMNFLNSDELKNGMENAGVTSTPEIFVGEDTK